MHDAIDYDRRYQRTCWLAYFDLLGIKSLVKSDRQWQVFEIYENALRRLQSSTHRQGNKVECLWFSDTFLIYTKDNSAAGFSAIDQISRWFIYFLILDNIPVRGALACGDFYADTSNRIFLGKALVEAYEDGEKQDWIGYLLCRSAVDQMSRVGLPADGLLHYIIADIPTKDKKTGMRRPACVLGSWLKEKSENTLLRSLLEMQEKCSNKPRIERKYKNTIEFIRNNS